MDEYTILALKRAFVVFIVVWVPFMLAWYFDHRICHR